MRRKKCGLIIAILIGIAVVGCGNGNEKGVNAHEEKKETVTIEGFTVIGEQVTTSENNIDDIIDNTSEISSTPFAQEKSSSLQEQESTTIKQEETTKINYTYSDINKTMYVKSSVNVRSLPSTDGDKIGGLSAGQQVVVTGQCNETNWYRIVYGDKTAFVSNNYLVEDKPIEETSQSEVTNKDAFIEFHNSFGCARFGSSNDMSGEQRYCQPIYEIHYEVTKETNDLLGECTNQKTKEWSELIKGYYRDDGTVMLFCGFAVTTIPIDEFENSWYKENAVVCEDSIAFDKYEYEFFEAPRYAILMECGYIQIIR